MKKLIYLEDAIDAITNHESERVLAINNLIDKDMVRAILEDLPSAQQDYKTDHGFMWLCPKCGLPVHSDFEKCVRCGYER